MTALQSCSSHLKPDETFQLTRSEARFARIV
jgi:hypothetical protein